MTRPHRDLVHFGPAARRSPAAGSLVCVVPIGSRSSVLDAARRLTHRGRGPLLHRPGPGPVPNVSAL